MARFAAEGVARQGTARSEWWGLLAAAALLLCAALLPLLQDQAPLSLIVGMGSLLAVTGYCHLVSMCVRHLRYHVEQLAWVPILFLATSTVLALVYTSYYAFLPLAGPVETFYLIPPAAVEPAENDGVPLVFISELRGWEHVAAGFYFSTSVLSSLGFGDMVAKGPWGRLLVSLEALHGMAHGALFVFLFIRNEMRRYENVNGAEPGHDARLKNSVASADTSDLPSAWYCRMDFLRNARVVWRLGMGFGLLLILVAAVVATGAIGGAAQKRAMQQVSEVSAEKVRLLSDLLDANNEMLVVRREMLIREGEAREEDEARIAALVKRYEASWKAYLQLPSDAAGKALADAVVAKRSIARPLNKQAGELMAQGDYPAAVALTLGSVREAANGWNKALADAVAHEQQQREVEAANAVALGERNVLILLVLGGVAMLVGIGASILIGRSMTAPLARAVQLADQMAKGQLQQNFDLGGRDELTRLGQAMASVRDNVQATITAQLDMASRHDAGEIRYRMQADAFPGDFGRMVAATNSLVESHVDVQFHMVEVMQRYAIGDLAPDLREYPGEKAVLTRTMATVKQNLVAISQQIDSLAEAAQAGDFSVRGDESVFRYQFKGMVARLNAMMAGAEQSIDDVSAVLTAIAAGDLGKRMEGEYHGVFARMRDDANHTSAQLTTIVRGIQAAAGSIDNAAQELAAGNADLSRRTEQQAANLEEAAASMEELTSTVRQNAELANQADREAHAAGEAVRATEQAMGQMAVVMREIDQSSARIAEITSVIDGIAFQTNILALNAAVEAARAGENGRGFAVVASEVRTLAQRAGTAAKEIKDLIEDASSKVQTGLGVTVQSEAAIGRLAQASARTNQLMSDIAAATKEQAAGIEQVNQVVVQMDQVTQQNAALVEEATAASRALEEQAQALTQSVAVFHLDGTATGTARRAA